MVANCDRLLIARVCELFKLISPCRSAVHCRNDWRPFRPLTNLYWLHYLMGKLLQETSYPRRDPDSQAVESEVRALHDMVLTGNYKSTSQLVDSSFYFDPCRIG